MASWGAASAKSKFSGLLDAAQDKGPQLIRRRKQVFVVTTEAEIERRLAEARVGKREEFISAWDALSGPADGLLDEKEFAEFSSAWARD